MPRTKETNAGYKIIQSETYGRRNDKAAKMEHRIVLGEMHTKRGTTQYVVWHNDRGVYSPGSDRETPVNSYYWGHYFASKLEAYSDYHMTLGWKYKVSTIEKD